MSYPRSADGSPVPSLGIPAVLSQRLFPKTLICAAAIVRPDTPTDGILLGGIFIQVEAPGAKIAADVVLPAMNCKGSLPFTGGGQAGKPSSDSVSLSPGKASLRAFVRALAAEQAPGGVRATVITLNGGVNSGAESWSASVVAQDYLDLHHQEAVSWTAEVVRN